MSDDTKKTLARFGIPASVLLLISGFVLGYISGVRADVSTLTPLTAHLSGADVSAPLGVDFSPVWKAWHTIDEKFVPAAVSSTTKASASENEGQIRVWGMISGMADSLGDPYTFFLPPREAKQFDEDISGSFEGVGMEIAAKDGLITVVSPLKGTPAERAGLKAGDQVLQIDGKDTHGMDVSDAVRRIRGPRGTVVTLIVRRSGIVDQFTIKVVRDVINVPIVTTKKLDNGVFDIQVSTFTATSPDLFRNALREFVESGNSKLIIDLRGNPGGYLEAAVDMASWFLPSGKTVVTEDYGKNGPPIVHRSRGYNIFNSNLRAVVLVDKGSASASEILADALRHYGIVKLIGTNTFGKGSVQELVPITDTTSLKVTVARWLGPDGVQIPTSGLVPDIAATTTDDAIKAGKDPQVARAVEFLTAGK